MNIFKRASKSRETLSKSADGVGLTLPAFPIANARCPRCKSLTFSVGSVTHGAATTEDSCTLLQDGALVCCCDCGHKYGVRAGGTYEPHENAMPGIWRIPAAAGPVRRPTAPDASAALSPRRLDGDFRMRERH